ncbi:alpha/beta hydrolase fold domain-containing protein [Streptomyces sp. NPDC059650]|uniref:alpha/beta hydrolase fold domain-containing protein n=1 Tax=Streptomyces sp. NPDC059650 TaxID=3346896 RepID=UPI0036820C33
MPGQHSTAEQANNPAPGPGTPADGLVVVSENGIGPYGQQVTMGHHVLAADQPAPIGAGSGPAPYDLLLAALGTCTSMALRMYAERKGWPLEKVTVFLRHQRVPAAQARAGQMPADRITREIRLEGDLGADQRKRLMEFAEKCPVHRALTAGATVTTTTPSLEPESSLEPVTAARTVPANYTADTHAALAAMGVLGHGGQVPTDVGQVRTGSGLAAVIAPPQILADVTTSEMPGPGGPIKLWVYRPAQGTGPRPGLVYFHGGGFVLDGQQSHDGFLHALAGGTGHVVVSVDYRLAPEHPFPAAVHDAQAATAYVAAHAAQFGIDPARLSVAGDSAGATLAAVTAQLAQAQGGPALARQVLIVPQTLYPPQADTASRRDLGEGYYLTTELLAWFADQYLPRPEDRTDPRAAPALAPALAGLPAVLVVTAGLDPLRDEGEQYAHAMASAGVEVRLHRLEGAFHLLWLATKTNPDVQADLIDAIAEHLTHA